MFVITDADGIALYRMLALQKMLKLECLGMKHSKGFSAYASIKHEFKLTGNKTTVLYKFTAMCEDYKKSRADKIARQEMHAQTPSELN